MAAPAASPAVVITPSVFLSFLGWDTGKHGILRYPVTGLVVLGLSVRSWGAPLLGVLRFFFLIWVFRRGGLSGCLMFWRSCRSDQFSGCPEGPPLFYLDARSVGGVYEVVVVNELSFILTEPHVQDCVGHG